MAELKDRESLEWWSSKMRVVSSIPVWSHTFVEIDHEIIPTVVLLSSAASRRVIDSYKQTYVLEVLVNCPGKQRVVR